MKKLLTVLGLLTLMAFSSCKERNSHIANAQGTSEVSAVFHGEHYNCTLSSSESNEVSVTVDGSVYKCTDTDQSDSSQGQTIKVYYFEGSGCKNVLGYTQYKQGGDKMYACTWGTDINTEGPVKGVSNKINPTADECIGVDDKFLNVCVHWVGGI
ncbi:MAG: hypothetical protein AB7T49_14585 [Oligoflexales bacterium]